MTGSDSTEHARRQWETAAPGWARWEPVVAAWMAPATRAMLDMSRVERGSNVLDLACGAGSQTLQAAERVGPGGSVIANDLAETMLRYVREAASASGLRNVTTLAGSAEELALEPEGLDAVICRLGPMLFSDPGRALATMYGALRPGGRLAAVVFTSPEANPIMAESMEILLRHAGKDPPQPGGPGIFALGGEGRLEGLLTETGFVGVEKRLLGVRLRMGSANEVLSMIQEGWGAYRAVLQGTSEAVQSAAWAEVLQYLRGFEAEDEFIASAEVLVAGGVKPT